MGTLERGPGRYCRELEVSGGPQPGIAILCHSPEGSWPVAALVALTPSETPTGFAPAGGEIEHDPAEAVREALGKPPFSTARGEPKPAPAAGAELRPRVRERSAEAPLAPCRGRS